MAQPDGVAGRHRRHAARRRGAAGAGRHRLGEGYYPTGVKVSDKEQAAIDLYPDESIGSIPPRVPFAPMVSQRQPCLSGAVRDSSQDLPAT